MKAKFLLSIALSIVSFQTFSQGASMPKDVPVKVLSPEDYINAYKDDAIKEMYLNKVPACITLAQGMLESGNGNSPLSRNANNHFGIKCHNEWGGDTYIMDDDSAGECFRKYSDVLESFTDHSMFLKSRSRYSPLFELPLTDYKAWCYGLKKAGYATDPRYAERLIEIIEKYKLQELNSIEPTPSKEFPRHDELKKPELAIREIYKFNRIQFVIAKEGDTFFKIAQNYNIPLNTLLEYNDFTYADKIVYGQKIYIQRKRRKALEPYHVVQKNETLKSVSQLHGIRLSSLCKKNKLNPTDKLKVGDILYLRQKKNS